MTLDELLAHRHEWAGGSLRVFYSMMDEVTTLTAIEWDNENISFIGERFSLSLPFDQFSIERWDRRYGLICRGMYHGEFAIAKFPPIAKSPSTEDEDVRDQNEEIQDG